MRRMARRAAGKTCVSRHQELPLCWTNPAPAGSKTWPMLAKHSPLSSAGGASVLTCVRKDKKCAAAVREKWGKHEGTAFQTPRWWRRRRSRCSRCRAEVALNTLEKSMVKKVVPLFKDHAGADTYPAAHRNKCRSQYILQDYNIIKLLFWNDLYSNCTKFNPRFKESP